MIGGPPSFLLPVYNFFHQNNKSEPMTNRQKVRIILCWWTLQESNLGRADLHSAALPTELRVRVGCESGLEPPTSGATNRRSDQLSYSHYEWLQGRESNPLGAAYEAVALPFCHPAVWCTK